MTELAFTTGQVAEIVVALVASNIVITLISVSLAYMAGIRSGESREREQWRARADREAYRQEKGIDR